MTELVHALERGLTRIIDWPIEDDPSTVASAVDEHGLLVLRCPDLTPLVRAAYAASTALFALPAPEKEALHYRSQPQGEFGNVGYFSPGLETAVGEEVPDPKEFFHVGRVDDPDHPLSSSYGVTPWPSGLEFPEVFRELYRRLDRVGQDVVLSLMGSLGARHESARAVMEDGHSILRTLHYPPMSDAAYAARPQWRAAPHVGIQMVGVQLPPSEPGLQFFTPDEEWVEPDFGEFQDCLFVNMGEMLETFSSGRFKPTLHRVRNAAVDEDVDRSRYSIVFFCHANLRGQALTVAGDGQETGLGKRWGDLLLKRLEELKLT